MAKEDYRTMKESVVVEAAAAESVEIIEARPRTTRVPQTFRALQHRNFQLYFIGQLISVAGTWMQVVAQAWLVYQLSHSELMLGVVGFAAAIPALLISPWAGVVVDRVNKRDLLVITQAAAMVLAFILAALTFTGVVQVWQVVLLAGLTGVVNAFDGPARQAFVVEMVGREDLSNAIAVNSMMFNGARIIGPALGGVLLATVGTAWCFFLNGVSFLAVIVCLRLMRLTPRTQVLEVGSPWNDLKHGLRYVLLHRYIFALLMLALIFSVFGISYNTVLPAFVDQILQGGASGYGLLNAFIGVGAVIGAFIMARYGDRGQRGRWLVWMILIFPFMLLLFASNTQFVVALGLAVGLGVGFMLVFTSINTLLQTNVDDKMRGRVMGLYTLTFFGFAPFGNLALGQLAELWGMSTIITLNAACTFILAALVIALVPQLRKMP
jgi:MFS family permease